RERRARGSMQGTCGNERHSWPVSPLGLGPYIANRLVEQNGNARPLPPLRLFIERDLLVGIGLAAQFRHHDAVNPDPTALDVRVGLTPRTHAALGHQLRDSNFFHGKTASL